MDRSASDRYELVESKVPLVSRIAQWTASLVAGLFTFGEAVPKPGTRQFTIVDKRTGAAVVSMRDRFGDGHDVGAQLRTDLAAMTVEQFEHDWIQKVLADPDE